MLTDNALGPLARTIEEAFESRDQLSADAWGVLDEHLEAGIAALDAGQIRAAVPHGAHWQPVPWVKKLILLWFMRAPQKVSHALPGQPVAFDKLALKFEGWDEARFRDAGFRVVPGAIVRRGAFIAPRAVLMPCFVNIGAYVGSGTMVDTWATIGSCAQVGARCHISGGAGIGGVLEPIGDAPTIIEDDVFIGARAEIAEGVVVRRGAVISMGVFLGRSTPVIDRESGEIRYGEVPENAVVIPGSRQLEGSAGLSGYAAIIVKRADEGTRGKTALNDLVRGVHR